jgi:hypothetical protein
MTTKAERELLKRIAALEQKVRELEARPPVVIHNYPPPVQPVQPTYLPLQPFPSWPIVTCGTGTCGGGELRALSW